MSAVIMLLLGIGAIYVLLYALKASSEVIKAIYDILASILDFIYTSIKRLLGQGSAEVQVFINPLLTKATVITGREDSIDKLKAYKASFVPMKTPLIKSWTKPAILSELLYERTPSNGIDIAEVETILSRSPSVLGQLKSALSNISGYPVPEPINSTTAVTPPNKVRYTPLDIEEPTIIYPVWSGLLSVLNPFVQAHYASDTNRVNAAKKKRLALLDLDVKQKEEIEAATKRAAESYKAVCQNKDKDFEQVHRHWVLAKEGWDKDSERDRFAIKNLVDLMESGDLIEMSEVVLSLLKLPEWIPTQHEISYDAQADLIILEYQLPDVGSVDWYKMVEQKFGYAKKPANQKEAKRAAELLYPSLALKLSYEIATQLNLSDDKAIVFNGWANFVVKATGNQKRAYCVALMSKVSQLKELNLSQVDPLAAFAALKGVAAKTLELTPIAPSITINMNDPRFIDNKEIVGKLSSEQNLASMDWEDFEHLCRELFERVFASNGAEVKVTQASRDQGVDAVIMDPDPIRGGKMVVQAKRYVNTVDVSAVRDLYGTMMNEGAMKGILVCTSQFGQESYAFIQGKPLTLINGNELLGLLEQHGYKFRIDLEEARKMMKDAGTTVAGRNKYTGVSHFKDE